MPRFSYKAKQGPGRSVTGELSAATAAEAQARLESMGYIPVWVREEGVEAGARIDGAERIRRGDVDVFTRQMAALLRSGVPMLRALNTVSSQAERPAMRRLADRLARAVEDGDMLSEAMARHPRVFPSLYVSMVRAGEAGGRLDEMLQRVAEARDRENDLQSRVRAATAYPLFVLAVGVASVVIMLVVFLPKIMGLLEGLGGPLPLPTRALWGLSRGLRNGWPWWMAAVMLCALGLRAARTRQTGRVTMGRILLRLPLVGRFLQAADIARWSRTLALLVRSGIPIERAVSLSADTVRNESLRQTLRQAGEETISAGTPLSSGLARRGEAPVFVAHMVAVGEETGRLEDALEDVAAYYERELERDLGLAITLLEPALILAVGVTVGFMIFAMLLPVFELGLRAR